MLSILALPARRKSEGETCDQKQEQNHCHHDNQHLENQDYDDDYDYDANDDYDDGVGDQKQKPNQKF